jgi:hypothetical protein
MPRAGGANGRGARRQTASGLWRSWANEAIGLASGRGWGQTLCVARRARPAATPSPSLRSRSRADNLRGKAIGCNFFFLFIDRVCLERTIPGFVSTDRQALETKTRSGETSVDPTRVGDRVVGQMGRPRCRARDARDKRERRQGEALPSLDHRPCLGSGVQAVAIRFCFFFLFFFASLQRFDLELAGSLIRLKRIYNF